MKWLPPVLLSLTALMLFAACHRLQPDHLLIINVEPPVIEAGQWVTVTAQASSPVELAYVSGTVELAGFPAAALKYDSASKTWLYRRFIPSFITIRPGKYGIKAWGETAKGEHYEGSTTVEAK